MPIKNGVGFSGATPGKQYALSMLLRQHIAITKSVIEKHDWASREYVFIDCNAGPGTNNDIDCLGSPLVFLDAISGMSISYKAYFVEIKSSNAHSLERVIGRRANCEVVCDNNQNAVIDIVSSLPDYSYGLIYTDPNGVPDFQCLLEPTYSLKNAQRLDALIRVSGSSVKRARCAGMTDDTRYLSQRLNAIKKHWIIQRIDPSDKFQWTFLLGTQWRGYKDWKTHGFYKINSQKGSEYFSTVDFTKEERKRFLQMGLL